MSVLCAALAAPASLAAANAVRALPPDCSAADACPQMIALPPAPAARLGSPANEPQRQADEGEHEVAIAAFAIARTEVTVGQYKLCVAEGGCAPPEWLEPDGQHNVETGISRYYRNLGERVTGDAYPIVGVSQDDAKRYAAWLTRRTGKTYRLPSEREWEFAARAGAATAYSWGAAPQQQQGVASANCRGCGSAHDGKGAAPVASFPPNAFGLHDMHGNVWEWVADAYCEDNAIGAPSPRARTAADCPQQRPSGLGVFRGGSSFYEPHLMRAAVRLRNRSDFKNFTVGFRVGRDLP